MHLFPFFAGMAATLWCSYEQVCYVFLDWTMRKGFESNTSVLYCTYFGSHDR